MCFAKLFGSKCPVPIPVETVGNRDGKGNCLRYPPWQDGQIAQEKPQQSLIDDSAAGADDTKFDELA